MQLIDKDKVIPYLEQVALAVPDDFNKKEAVAYCNGIAAAKDIILRQNVMEAVEVVRCQNCQHYNPDCETCGFWHGVRHPEHYCGEGEGR